MVSIGGTGSVWDGTGRYLVVLGQYKAVRVDMMLLGDVPFKKYNVYWMATSDVPWRQAVIRYLLRE